MKLIIAGSHTFTDYQHLCQVLAPDRHRITQVITGGARGADQLGYRWAWKHAVRHQLFRASGSASARPQACAAITRWPRLATCSSRSGPPIARHRAPDPVHARLGQARGGRQRRHHRVKNESWARMPSSHPRASEPREGSTARRINPLTHEGSDPWPRPYHTISPPCNTPSRTSPAMKTPTPCAGSRPACTRHSSSRAHRAATPAPTPTGWRRASTWRSAAA